MHNNLHRGTDSVIVDTRAGDEGMLALYRKARVGRGGGKGGGWVKGQGGGGE